MSCPLYVAIYIGSVLKNQINESPDIVIQSNKSRYRVIFTLQVNIYKYLKNQDNQLTFFFVRGILLTRVNYRRRLRRNSFYHEEIFEQRLFFFSIHRSPGNLHLQQRIISSPSLIHSFINFCSRVYSYNLDFQTKLWLELYR